MGERDEWDAAAATFDEEADHGLRDPGCRAAWSALLRTVVPAQPSRVVDLGCGTGSISAVLVAQGHAITGVDFSEAMVGEARRKASEVRLVVGDVAAPPLRAGSFDVVFARHVLWAMPDPEESLRAWTDLLSPDGRLVLVEGRWQTGAGLSRDECVRLVGRVREDVTSIQLTDPVLWGGPVSDERYLVVSEG